MFPVIQGMYGIEKALVTTIGLDEPGVLTTAFF
jgi:hypothetical protein